MTEEEQIATVKRDPNSIKYITNPSERVQLMAVNQSIYAIQDIENPTENVKSLAVKRDAYSINCIKDPSKDLLIFALLQLMKDGHISDVNKLMNKFSNRNYPEFNIIRQSINNYR